MVGADGVIFEAGTVERDYGGVTVAVHADHDVKASDWMASMQRFAVQVERDRKEAADAERIADGASGSAA